MTPDEIADLIWRSKYRYTTPDGTAEPDRAATLGRVARAVAAAEADPASWEQRFADLLHAGRLLPGGRILAAAGTPLERTLLNCFVMAPPEDSVEAVFDGLREGAITLQMGGGIGYDFSRLRPRGASAHRTGRTASGPVSFMDLYDSMCRTMQSASSRRGAMMASLRCDHPDILRFIRAKSDGGFSHTNLSVQVTDAFMRAVEEDAPWPLRFPVGCEEPVATITARELWEAIVAQAHTTGDPGLLFVDTMAREDNLGDRETITVTNPCGEVPLPAYGSCCLASLDLSRFVSEPFMRDAALDLEALGSAAATAARFLDDVLEITAYPLPAQREAAHRTRRVGLGITGLADTLAMLGLRYDTPQAHRLAVRAMIAIRDAAYASSVDTARERGAFPDFDADSYLASRFVQRLPDSITSDIASHGIRNSHLLAIAPTGSISLLAGNVSSGIEPIYALEQARRVRIERERVERIQLTDRAWHVAKEVGLQANVFVTAHDLTPQAHLAMQLALQPLVDNAVSKTVNLRAGTTVAEVTELFRAAHSGGAKGITVFPSAGGSYCPRPISSGTGIPTDWTI